MLVLSFMNVKDEVAVRKFMRGCSEQCLELKTKKKKKELTEKEIVQCENELAESVINYVKKDAVVKVRRKRKGRQYYM